MGEEIGTKELFKDLIELSVKVDQITKQNKKTVLKFQLYVVILVVLSLANILLHILLILK